MNDPQQRKATLDAGNPIGMLDSMTIKAAIIGIVTVLGVFGSKLVISDVDMDKIVQGVGALVTIGALIFAIIGRVRAQKVVEPGASKDTPTPPPTPPIPVLLFGMCCLMLVTQTGCPALTPTVGEAPITRIYAARQAFTGALNGANRLIETGMIIDQKQKQQIHDVAHQINDALDQAETKEASGDHVGYLFLIEQVDSLLTKFLPLTKPKSPATRASLSEQQSWKPSFSDSLRPASLLCPDSSEPSRLCRPAEHSPRIRNLSFVASKRPSWPDSTRTPLAA